jgi:hypothetical protein
MWQTRSCRAKKAKTQIRSRGLDSRFADGPSLEPMEARHSGYCSRAAAFLRWERISTRFSARMLAVLARELERIGRAHDCRGTALAVGAFWR